MRTGSILEKSLGSKSESEGVSLRTCGRRSEKEEGLSEYMVNIMKEAGKLNTKGEKLIGIDKIRALRK